METVLPPALYTLHDAAKVIGCTRNHVYKIARRGDLKTVLVNGRMRVSPYEVYRYLATRD
jgi:excisionase family DNA binding protein